MMKKLAIGALIVVVVAGGVSAVVVERLKPMLERELRAALQTPVTVGSLGWIPPVGVRVRDVVAQNPAGFSPRPWATVRAVDVRVAIWSLLRRRPIVVDVALARPELFVEQASDGRMNLPKPPAPPAPPPSGRKPPPAPTVIPGRFLIRDGTLTFVDRRRSPSGVEVVLAHLQADVRLGWLPAGYRYQVTGALVVPGSGEVGHITLQGQATLDQRTEATVQIVHRALQQVSPYLHQALGAEVTAGEGMLRAQIRGVGDQCSAQIHAELQGLTFARDDLMTALGIPAQQLVRLLQDAQGRIELDFTVSGRWDQLQVAWDQLLASAMRQALQNAVARHAQRVLTDTLTEGKSVEDLAGTFKALGQQLKGVLKGRSSDDASQDATTNP